jgi:hypothetical protein
MTQRKSRKENDAKKNKELLCHLASWREKIKKRFPGNILPVNNNYNKK